MSQKQRHKLAQEAEKEYWTGEQDDGRERRERIRRYWEQYTRIINKLIKLDNNSRILDIGCGPYGLINFIKTGEKYGLDPLMDYYLQKFSMSPGIKWLAGYAENVPFQENFFDLVISTNAVDHTADPVKAFVEMRRVLKDRGYLFLTINTYPRWIKILRDFLEKIGEGDAPHPFTFTRCGVEKNLEKLDFKIIKKIDGVGDLRSASARHKETIIQKPKNKILKAFGIARKGGFLKLLKSFIEFFIRSFSGIANRAPRRYSIFIAVK